MNCAILAFDLHDEPEPVELIAPFLSDAKPGDVVELIHAGKPRTCIVREVSTKMTHEHAVQLVVYKEVQQEI